MNQSLYYIYSFQPEVIQFKYCTQILVFYFPWPIFHHCYVIHLKYVLVPLFPFVFYFKYCFPNVIYYNYFLWVCETISWFQKSDMCKMKQKSDFIPYQCYPLHPVLIHLLQLIQLIVLCCIICGFPFAILKYTYILLFSLHLFFF